jgi:hypothetical protein
MTARVLGIGGFLALLCGCAAHTQTSAAAEGTEFDCSFRSPTTCWTVSGRFPEVRSKPTVAPLDRPPRQPPAVLASEADSARSATPQGSRRVPMNLRICDGERERRVPASIELVEQAFAPGVPIREGTEITLVEGERWLAALAVSGPEAGTGEEAGEFLLSGATGEAAEPSGRMGRSEVLRQFRRFVLTSGGS